MYFKKELSFMASILLLILPLVSSAEPDDAIGWHLVLVNETPDTLNVKFLGQDNWNCHDLCSEQTIKGKHSREFYSSSSRVNTSLTSRLSIEVNGVQVDFHNSGFESQGKSLVTGTVYAPGNGVACEEIEEMLISSSESNAIAVEINTGTQEVCRKAPFTITTTLSFRKPSVPTDQQPAAVTEKEL